MRSQKKQAFARVACFGGKTGDKKKAIFVTNGVDCASGVPRESLLEPSFSSKLVPKMYRQEELLMSLLRKRK